MSNKPPKQLIIRNKLGDEIILDIKRTKVVGSVFCDNNGFDFEIDKDKLRELLK